MRSNITAVSFNRLRETRKNRKLGIYINLNAFIGNYVIRLNRLRFKIYMYNLVMFFCVNYIVDFTVKAKLACNNTIFFLIYKLHVFCFCSENDYICNVYSFPQNKNVHLVKKILKCKFNLFYVHIFMDSNPKEFFLCIQNI